MRFRLPTGPHVLMAILLAPGLGYANDQCDRLFSDLQELATCQTLANLYAATVSDDELRDQVSLQIHGRPYREAEAERQKREEEARKAEERIRQAADKDRCGQLFSSPYERDVCRWHQVVTGRNERDADLRNSVAERIQAIESDPAIKATFSSSISRIRESVVTNRLRVEEQARREAEQEEARRAEAERQAKEAEERAKEEEEQAKSMAAYQAEHERRMRAEREKWDRLEAEQRKKKRARAQAAAAKLDAALRSEDVGLLLKGWRLGGFGVILVSDVLLQNNKKHDVRDLRIACQTFGESGTQLSQTMAIVYSRLRPGERRGFEVNMGRVHPQSATASCRVVDWK